jgi:hypothetical protein
LERNSLTTETHSAVWQLLDVGSIWMKEFTSALAHLQPVTAWEPRMLLTGMLQEWTRELTLSDPPLTIHQFPLQRGYARTPLRQTVGFEQRILRRLLARGPDAAHAPLICTTPFYASVAERWPGPVAYYSTDLTSAYDGLEARQVHALEQRMCQVATAIYPNSRRIAEHLCRTSGCAPDRITIIPNATRASNVAEAPRLQPGPLPNDVIDLSRPIVGVLGNLSGNMDWQLLAEAIHLTPKVHWLFVGPAESPIAEPAQDEARTWVKHHARFTGARPYGALQAYARCLDVAVLPYCKKEPTFSGSSTRFYEHLAALRPMLATRGFAELLEKEPLLQLVDTAEELAEALQELSACGFDDGHIEQRWLASRDGTWETRARTLHDDLLARIGPLA